MLLCSPLQRLKLPSTLKPSRSSRTLLWPPQPGTRFWSSRLANRWSNSAAYINAACLVRTSILSGRVDAATFVLGLDTSMKPGERGSRLLSLSPYLDT